MILILLILSLMIVVGSFLINSVEAFYLRDFYTRVATRFSDSEMISDLRTPREEEENGAEMLDRVLSGYSGELGVDGLNRQIYILDETGAYLTGGDREKGKRLEYTDNLTTAVMGEIGQESNAVADYMDIAIPIQRGDEHYIIYIVDNKAAVSELTNQMLILILEALGFGLLISILLSFLLSKTITTPIQRLTEGAMRVAEGDFSNKIEVDSQDEIGVLTDTFNDMAGQLRDTLGQVENERNKLDTLFLHMTDGVVAFSRKGKLIHANPAVSRILGRKIDNQTTYEELFGELAALDEVMNSPDYLERGMEENGRYMQLQLAPFDRDSRGGVLAVIHDITEQRKNEEMRKEFVANVSHELRTPLTNIRSYAETLADSAGDLPPEMEKKFLGVILNESDRMTHIVQDLLTLSRFDSGREDLKLTRFSFASAVQDLYNAVFMEAQRHDHTLTVAIQPNMPEIVADRERILQVMMNVVSNSIKYTPNGGKIQIYAGHKDHFVWMVVVDNGIGIPEKDRPRIFERFYRVDKARSRQSGGTGLGLSIAREIITKHEGTLELVDKEGPGLAVRMELKVEGPGHG